MEPNSLPVVPAQPSAATYSAAALCLFHRFSRAEYTSTFGVLPPVFDPSKKQKYWFDTSIKDMAPDDYVTYKVLRLVNNAWTVKTVVMPVCEAMSVNIPLDGAIAGSSALSQKPEWETPIRDLLANEQLLSIGPFGVNIVRTDLSQSQDEAAGKFTQADRAILHAIADKLGIKL